MKNLFLAFVFTSFAFTSYSQTLFTYGNHSVSVSEFLNAYNKNKTAAADSAAALRNYLDLYINFKLKVQAAKDIQLDTVPSLVADLQNFRGQVEDNYLNDEAEVDKLVSQAFERSQKDIHVVYYFISSTDSGKAKNVAKEVEEKLKSNESKDVLTLETTDVKIEKGDPGFITVFSLPYDFENIVYRLKPGEISLPYHSKNGWYIFKDVNERPAVGKITVAQILFAVPEGDDSQKEKIKRLADSVYNLLQNGGDFSSLAKQFSDDRTTFMNGGLMPEFGTAKYDSVFEDHAFALKKDGEISKPFETKFGFHILKRISAMPVPSTKNDNSFMYNLKLQVLSDSRVQTAKQKFIQEILPKIGFKKSNISQSDLWRVTDTALLNNKYITSENVNENSTLFSYNNNAKVTVRDWIDFVKNSNKIVPEKMHESYQKIFPAFAEASSVANYASRLEHFDPAFKSQIDEFEEGNMLFEIMQTNVWNKATADTSGLRKFYDQHQQKYFWNSSAEAVIFSCSDKNVAQKAMKALQKGKRWREIIADNSSQVQADSGRFELGQIPVVDRTDFTDGLITMPVINKNDGTAVFAKILKVYPSHQHRSFEDARGLVINDYQNFLEQKWIDQLKKKYPVKVNEKVFQTLVNKSKK